MNLVLRIHFLKTTKAYRVRLKFEGEFSSTGISTKYGLTQKISEKQGFPE
ncbi:hypothetical protein HYS97_01375 [Candidatus Daviesbacteria bacterium]|nr:hypothetical protein [Candidatus Daviesbacteria bacterium]